MSSTISKNDEENDSPLRDDGYANGAAMNAGATGIGGTTTASETLDRVGTAASQYNDPEILNRTTAANLTSDSTYDADGDNSPVKWLVPLVIVLLLIISGYTFCSNPHAADESGTITDKFTKIA